MAVAVVLSGVNKFYGTSHVVKDVNLTFPPLNFVTLLGPSGCGKTTVLRMIAGLESITSGDIYFGERRMNMVRPGERDVAMVFQSYALYPNMNVFNNIAYGLRVRRTPKAQLKAKVREVAEILEISPLLDRKPRHLSGGQRQRVALGRAMVRNPAVFLMDEPLSNLDAKLRVTMRSELKVFHKRLGTTTVYVTHDQLEAMTMSDLIAVMYDGAVQQFGPPEEIYNRPSNVFVAGFIGSPPMNFLDARIGEEPQPTLQLNDAVLPVPPEFTQGVGNLGNGKAVVLGIRPQEVSLDNPESSDSLPGQVSMIELLGSEKLVEIRLGGSQKIVAQVRADHPVATDDKVKLALGPSNLHLFDKQTGASLRA